MADVSNKVKEIIAEHLALEEEEVALDASFMDDLGADSLDGVELLMEFEDEFDIVISDEDAEKLLTVGDVVNYIKSNV